MRSMLRRGPRRTVEVCTLVITYEAGNRHETFPCVLVEEAGRLNNMVAAYQELTRLHAKLKPYDDTRAAARTVLGAIGIDMGPTPQPRPETPKRTFSLSLITVQRGKIRGKSLKQLKPWEIKSVEQQDITTVEE